MVVVQSIGDGNVHLIPAAITGLVPADQRGSKAYSVRNGRPSCWVLSSRMWLCFEPLIPLLWGKPSLGPRSASRRTDRSQRLLLRLGQVSPPRTKLVCVLDIPTHGRNIALVKHSVNGMSVRCRSNLVLAAGGLLGEGQDVETDRGERQRGQTAGDCESIGRWSAGESRATRQNH